jgi:drug/metabolite transporter (DMT)-like permease
MLMWAEVVGRRPVVAAIAGACCIASSAVLVRLADVAPVTAAVFRCAYALPVLALLAAAERRRYGPRPRSARRIALIAGVFFAADLVLWHYAIAAVGAGLATVLGNLQVVVVAFLAWAVLGERVEQRLLVAVPVVLAGVVLLSGVIGSDAYGDDPVGGVLFGVATSLAYAGFILLLRQGNADVRRPAGPLLDATAVAAVTAAVFGVVTGGVDLVPHWPAHGWLALLALTSQILGWLLLSVSLPRLPAALPSLLLLIQPVGALWLGVILLGEQPSAVQLIGVAVVLSGVILAASRRRDRDREPVPA